MTNEQMRQAIMACLNCDDIMLASYGDPNLYVLNPAGAIRMTRCGAVMRVQNIIIRIT